jgi:hypothetical protein
MALPRMKLGEDVHYDQWSDQSASNDSAESRNDIPLGSCFLQRLELGHDSRDGNEIRVIQP